MKTLGGSKKEVVLWHVCYGKLWRTPLRNNLLYEVLFSNKIENEIIRRNSLTAVVTQGLEVFRNGQRVVALKITETRVAASRYDTHTEFLGDYLRESFLDRCSEYTAERSKLWEGGERWEGER